jgi:hypothetical protein
MAAWERTMHRRGIGGRIGRGELLIERKLIGADEIRRQIEVLDRPTSFVLLVWSAFYDLAYPTGLAFGRSECRKLTAPRKSNFKCSRACSDSCGKHGNAPLRTFPSARPFSRYANASFACLNGNTLSIAGRMRPAVRSSPISASRLPFGCTNRNEYAMPRFLAWRTILWLQQGEHERREKVHTSGASEYGVDHHLRRQY